MKSFLFLLGKPASGKGTQIRRISTVYGGRIFSVGEALKDHIARKTDLGMKVKEIMNSGKLVSDDIVMDLFKDFVSSVLAENNDGLVLIDGFPRTTVQYEMLSSFISEKKLSYKFIDFSVTDDHIFKRLEGRLLCSGCYAPFSTIGTELKQGDDCPGCKNGKLKKRDDDSAEVMKNRMVEFNKLTAPMIELISGREKERFNRVDASKGEDEIFSEVEKLLQGFGNKLKK